ncbi:auxin response factor 5 isoform X1 [Prunus yedoensis var. nudiflora]|uniref:Auxin response factor 5 isoform X1 n=1 Tax=Prunus yedoensis var. nudiflora TaxID=2094558 RepID=A0A314U9J0_PRUYE|nr:auxin response factor 5 isoform X1 [Prunus yedoensis var. nudiflora]
MDQSAAINMNTSHAILRRKLNDLTKFGSQTTVVNSTDKTKLDTDFSADQLSQLNSTGQGIEDKLAAGFVNQLTFANQNQSAAQLQNSPRPMQPPLESLLYHFQQTDMPHSDFNSTNGSLPFLDNDECIFYQSCQPFAGIYGCPNVDVGSGVSTVIDPSVSSTILDEFSTLKMHATTNAHQDKLEEHTCP